MNDYRVPTLIEISYNHNRVPTAMATARHMIWLCSFACGTSGEPRPWRHQAPRQSTWYAFYIVCTLLSRAVTHSVAAARRRHSSVFHVARACVCCAIGEVYIIQEIMSTLLSKAVTYSVAAARRRHSSARHVGPCVRACAAPVALPTAMATDHHIIWCSSLACTSAAQRIFSDCLHSLEPGRRVQCVSC